MAHKYEDGITLISGKVFDFMNPGACELDIEDVAVPLAQVCRYAGQLPLGRWYSVAQHAVNTSRIVPHEHKFTALMHDTAEAFTNDIVTPLKRAVPLFKEIEVAIETVMARKFRFTFPLPPAVVQADREMLALETKHIRGVDLVKHDHLVGCEIDHLYPLVDLSSWTPERAYHEFMDAYHKLRPC
jgi:hypothetical protein